jgi:hypothetical protein
MTRIGLIFLPGLVLGASISSHSEASARVPWPAFRGLFPGPKPEKWILSSDDVSHWSPQAARSKDLSAVGAGDYKTWTFLAKPATALVVRMPLEVGCEFGPPSFIVGVLDGSASLIARSSELFSEGSNPDSTGRLYRIDTGPYRISDSETAFAVRVDHVRTEKHYCYSDQVFHLFRVVGNDVVRILTTDSFYEQFDQIDLAKEDSWEAQTQVVNDPLCSYGGKVFPPKGQSAVFHMLPTQTNGYYDLQRSKKGWPTTTFRWNGHTYALDGKDPIDHHVREEWDWCTGRRELAERAWVFGGAAATSPAPRSDSTLAKQSSPGSDSHSPDAGQR